MCSRGVYIPSPNEIGIVNAPSFLRVNSFVDEDTPASGMFQFWITRNTKRNSMPVEFIGVRTKSLNDFSHFNPIKFFSCRGYIPNTYFQYMHNIPRHLLDNAMNEVFACQSKI
jgi:hypothetical protein